MDKVEQFRSGHVVIGVDTHKPSCRSSHGLDRGNPRHPHYRDRQRRISTPPGSGSYFTGLKGLGRLSRSGSKERAHTAQD